MRKVSFWFVSLGVGIVFFNLNVTDLRAQTPGNSTLVFGAGGGSRENGTSRFPSRLHRPYHQRSSFLNHTSTKVALGLTATALLSVQFENQDHVGKRLGVAFLDGAIEAGNTYGMGSTAGIASLGVLAVGKISGDRYLARSGQELSKSLLATWAAVWALKLSINSRRPDGGPYSFPSGHTATAFATAPVVSRRFGNKAGLLAYAMATLTGMARLEDNRHYPADVLVGAAIGIVVGHELSTKGMSIGPAGRGLGLSLKF